ncbi:GNAT family N-acetyltransferase [Tetragenococcus halophilus]|nr:GNAT family N-acetyltransferase [Tetragenococcus halophilus]
MNIKTKEFDNLENWITYENQIFVNNELLGKAYSMVEYDEDGDKKEQVYLEDIIIYEQYRNQGFGTQAIKMLAEENEFLYFAPTDENNQRLYKRIASDMEEEMSDVPEVDQGFGVYFLEK